MHKLTTANGHDVPMVGLGTYPLQGEAMASMALDAFKCGYRLIDTADDYRGETGLGLALSRLNNETGFRREDVFIQTKISQDNAHGDEPLEGVWFSEGWNFGPRAESITPVWDVATDVIKNYGSGKLNDISNSNVLHEAKLLMLDISKAKFQLGWEPRMNIHQCIELTVDWYKKYQNVDSIYMLCLNEIFKFTSYKK